MLPPKPWEPAEVRVSGHPGPAMLDRNRSMMGVGDQPARGPGLAAQCLKYLKVFGTGSHDARGRSLRRRGYERKRPLKGRWRIEDTRVGHYPNKAGQNEYGQGERFGPRGQTGDPVRVFRMVRDGVLNMRIHEGIYVRKLHTKSPAPVAMPCLVILCVKCSRPVEIDPGAGMNTTHRHQNERGRLRRLPTLHRIIQRPCSECAYADAGGVRFTAHLPGEAIIKRNCGPHDALASQFIISASHCRTPYSVVNAPALFRRSRCPDRSTSSHDARGCEPKVPGSALTCSPEEALKLNVVAGQPRGPHARSTTRSRAACMGSAERHPSRCRERYGT